MRKRHLSLRVLFVTFFREKKVELCCSLQLLLWGERAFDFASLSLSLWRSLSRRRILSNALSWCTVWVTVFGGVGQSLLLRRTCAFSLVKVKVLFFPLYRRRAFMYCHTRKQSSHLSWIFFFCLVLGGEGGVRDEAQIFLKRSHSLSDDIFLCFLPSTTHQHKEEIYIYIYNNAAFPRAIP